MGLDDFVGSAIEHILFAEEHYMTKTDAARHHLVEAERKLDEALLLIGKTREKPNPFDQQYKQIKSCWTNINYLVDNMSEQQRLRIGQRQEKEE